MKKYLKTIVIVLALVIAAAAISIPVLGSIADEGQTAQQTEAVAETGEETITAVSEVEEQTKGTKAMAAAIVVGISAAAGALGMALAIARSVEGVARQPEASGKIQTMLMLGLVFIETAIIYALIVAILIIFVL